MSAAVQRKYREAEFHKKVFRDSGGLRRSLRDIYVSEQLLLPATETMVKSRGRRAQAALLKMEALGMEVRERKAKAQQARRSGNKRTAKQQEAIAERRETQLLRLGKALVRHGAVLGQHEELRSAMKRRGEDGGLRQSDIERLGDGAVAVLNTMSPIKRHKKDDLDNMLGAMEYYREQGKWKEVVDMARALDTSLAASTYWGRWKKSLDMGKEAAEKLGDRDALAFMHNQLGIYAMSRNELYEAEAHFAKALVIRRALGNRDGSIISGWNLQVVNAALYGPPR